jgi:hypothetical protein
MNEAYVAVLIPVINGLIELAKQAGLPNRYAPLLALALGLGAGIGLRNPGDPMATAILNGLVIGLSAVGLYSGTRNEARISPSSYGPEALGKAKSPRKPWFG